MATGGVLSASSLPCELASTVIAGLKQHSTNYSWQYWSTTASSSLKLPVTSETSAKALRRAILNGATTPGHERVQFADIIFNSKSRFHGGAQVVATLHLVKISLFDTTGVELLNIRFNATGSTSNNWITKDRVISSPFTDIASLQYFSVERYNGTSFYMASQNGCAGDAGWLLMLTKHGICDWQTSHIELPVFLYSTVSTRVNWNNGIDAGLGKADVFAIFIKTKNGDNSE